MTEEKLKYLLEKFYNGLSTPEMEERLRQFFLSDAPVSEKFKADKAMFMAMSQHPEIPEGLGKRIADATINKSKRRKRLLLGISATAAACAAIITLTYNPIHDKPTYREVTNHEEALAILCMVDMKLQSAISPVQKGLTELDNANIKIQTTLNKVLSL